MNYSNEPSLRQRLRALIEIAKDGRTDKMPAYDRSFINSVVNTRNHETHHGVRPDNLLVGAEMYWAIRRLVVLLTALFLRRLGLSPSMVDSVLAKHQEFQTLWTTKEAP